MAAEQQIPAEPAVRKSRAGRDLPAAILVGLGLATTVVLTLLFWNWGFVLLVTAMLTLGTFELHDALKRIGMNSAVAPIMVGTVAVICGSYAAATQEGTNAVPWHSVLLGFLGATVLAALVWRMPGGSAGYVKDSAASLFTIGYIPLLGSFTSLILAAPNGSAKMATILLVVMGTDTGGYAVGARIGKHLAIERLDDSGIPHSDRKGIAQDVRSLFGRRQHLANSDDANLVAGLHQSGVETRTAIPWFGSRRHGFGESDRCWTGGALKGIVQHLADLGIGGRCQDHHVGDLGE